MRHRGELVRPWSLMRETLRRSPILREIAESSAVEATSQPLPGTAPMLRTSPTRPQTLGPIARVLRVHSGGEFYADDFPSVEDGVRAVVEYVALLELEAVCRQKMRMYAEGAVLDALDKVDAARATDEGGKSEG